MLATQSQSCLSVTGCPHLMEPVRYMNHLGPLEMGALKDCTRVGPLERACAEAETLASEAKSWAASDLMPQALWQVTHRLKAAVGAGAKCTRRERGEHLFVELCRFQRPNSPPQRDWAALFR